MFAGLVAPPRRMLAKNLQMEAVRLAEQPQTVQPRALDQR